MCKRYTNQHNTSFIKCDFYNNGSQYDLPYLLVLSDTQHYPENMRFYPYCGKKLKITEERGN